VVRRGHFLVFQDERFVYTGAWNSGTATRSPEAALEN
jgi:hypothetical protein